ncbi:MAG: S8 family serine peptidase [Myxococcota bacterium]
MGDAIVRATQSTTAVAPGTTAAAPANEPATPAPATSIIRRFTDLIDLRQRGYIVFGDPGVMELQAPQGFTMRGTSPTGEAWTTARLTSGQARALQERGVRVVEDVEVSVPEPQPSSDFEANNVFGRDIHEVNELNALGPEFEGEGGLFITVDTGVAPHRDLPPTVRFDNVYTEQPEDPQADVRRHGTHVSGSAVARGNPDAGGTRGMAPRASLAGVQVLQDNGRGTSSAILRGIERAVEFARAHDGFVVVNMSLGGPARGDIADNPMVQAIERATREHGILFTISAGNSGPGLGTVGSPGIAPSAITVGAMDHRNTPATSDDVVARFSSRDREGGPKPTLTARGVNVRSTLPGDAYGGMSGTSMSSPITGGAVLALGQGLLAMYRRGELRVDPRELVKTGEFQRIVAEAALDNPNVASNHEGAGDLRIMAAYRLFVQRFGTANTAGPAPYVPASRLPRASYRTPF